MVGSPLSFQRNLIAQVLVTCQGPSLGCLGRIGERLCHPKLVLPPVFKLGLDLALSSSGDSIVRAVGSHFAVKCLDFQFFCEWLSFGLNHNS